MPEAQSLPYLADVARLEWARQQAYLAADAAALDRQRLDEVAESAAGRLHLTLHPSLQLVISEHPVWDIWMFCQDDAPEHLELSGDGQAVAVWREASRIGMKALAAGERQWLAALLAGEPLVAACEQALEMQPGFAVAAGLQWLLNSGLITGLSVNRLPAGPT
jgi:hypothetical protein